MDRLLPATRRMTGLPLRPRLTLRNLRKRRHRRQVKMAETPGPKWESGGQAGSPLPPGLSLIRSASSRQLRVARTSLVLELGNSVRVVVAHDGGSRTCQRARRRAEVA